MKKRTLSFSVTLLLVVTILLSVGSMISAQAIPPVNSLTKQIFYLYDYYPSAHYRGMANEFPDYNIVYYKITDLSDVEMRILRGDFSGTWQKSAVVIDIKYYLPDTGDLLGVLSALREMGHKTQLVSPFSKEESHGDQLDDVLDDYQEIYFERMDGYLTDALSQISLLQEENERFNILIDFPLLGEFDPYQTYSFQYIYENSIFLRMFLKKIVIDIMNVSTPTTWEEAYNLFQAGPIDFWVYLPNGTLLNIFTGTVVFGSSAEIWLQNEALFAMGFTHLTASVWNFLHIYQGQGYTIHGLLMEIEPPVFTEDGLMVGVYGDLTEEGLAVIAGLRSILGNTTEE